MTPALLSPLLSPLLLSPLLSLLLPLFLLAGLGAALARTGLVAGQWQAGLNELTARLFIPALLFSGAYHTGIPAAVSWQFMAAFFLPLVVLFLMAYGARRDASVALGAIYSNTVFVGIPVLTQAFGPGSLQYAFPVIAFHGLVAFSLYYLASPGAGGAVRAVFSAVKSPVVTSLMLGLAVNLMGVRLPAAASSLLSMLSGAALPCALLALGASLVRFRIRSWPETAGIAMLKLVALPACVAALAFYVFRLPAPAASALVVLAACPVGGNAAALVQADGNQGAPVASAILLSTLGCLVTLPFWIWSVTRP